MSTKFKTTTLALAVSLALGTVQSYAAEDDASKAKEKNIATEYVVLDLNICCRFK